MSPSITDLCKTNHFKLCKIFYLTHLPFKLSFQIILAIYKNFRTLLERYEIEI